MMEINLSSSNVNDPIKLDFNDFHNLAPLNQLQEDSFLELAEISVNRPMPIEVNRFDLFKLDLLNYI